MKMNEKNYFVFCFYLLSLYFMVWNGIDGVLVEYFWPNFNKWMQKCILFPKRYHVIVLCPILMFQFISFIYFFGLARLMPFSFSFWYYNIWIRGSESKMTACEGHSRCWFFAEYLAPHTKFDLLVLYVGIFGCL